MADALRSFRAPAPVLWRGGLETSLVFAVFALHAAWPVPDGNEPFYLAKARHFWDPAWGAGQLFLETGNAHAVFYTVVGWLSLWLPLEGMAWTIRIATWALLAWAWRRLSMAVLPAPGWAVLSAALLVTLNARCSMAGEWIVGSAEAKGFAYVLVFLALERLARGAWKGVWPLLGLATSFHVLVGGWSFLAAGLVGLFAGKDRPPPRAMAAWMGVGCLLAAPGLGALLRLNHGVDPHTLGQAAQILVFERAPHHLSPLQFSAERILRHLLLVGVWFALGAVSGSEPELHRFRRFAGAALFFAAIGLLVAVVGRDHPEAAANILQVYWFRLSDAMIPAGVALGLVVWAHRLRAATPRRGLGLVMVLATFAGGDALSRGGRILSSQVPRADRELGEPEGWREACSWIAAHTPPDVRFLTPPEGGTFAWYTGRWDVVNWKDVPQDAAGVVEWYRRMRRLHGARSVSAAKGGSGTLAASDADRLRRLGREFDAAYAILPRNPKSARPALPEIYGNHGYIVVRLDSLAPSRE